MNKAIKWILVLVVMILVVWAVSTDSKKEINHSGSMKVGVLIPLTGKLGSYGEDMRNALEVAKKQLGKSGDRIVYVYEDSAADAKTALSAVEKLTSTDNVDFIIAGPGSSALMAVAPILEQKGVPVVALSAAPKLKQAGTFIFRALPDVGEEVELVARDFISKGYTKVAMVYDSSADSNVAGKDQFVASFKQLGGTEVIVQGYDIRTVSDFKTIFSSLNAQKPEAVYFLGSEVSTGVALAHARQVGVTVPVYGWAAAENPSLITTADKAAEGYTFTAFPFACDINPVAYCTLYKTAYPGAEPLVYGVRTFDLMNIIASSTSSDDSRADFMKMFTSKSYSGVSGQINFDAEGNVGKQDFIFKTIKDGKFVQVDN